jgi:putative addiction module component (TIGR02574 family)
MSTFDDVFHAAQDLPPAERVRLIEALLDTVSADDWPMPSESWIAESERRSKAYDEGRMTAAPWPEVKQRARRKAGLDA